jgi:hypothetical protein
MLAGGVVQLVKALARSASASISAVIGKSYLCVYSPTVPLLLCPGGWSTGLGNPHLGTMQGQGELPRLVQWLQHIGVALSSWLLLDGFPR